MYYLVSNIDKISIKISYWPKLNKLIQQESISKIVKILVPSNKIEYIRHLNVKIVQTFKKLVMKNLQKKIEDREKG